MTCFLIKNYKINLHIRNSQTGTKLKPIFAIDSQTHASKKKFTNPPMREREGGESEETQARTRRQF